MLADSQKGVEYFDSEVLKESQDVILRIDCEKFPFLPSIEDSGLVMSYVIDRLKENPEVTRIVLFQRRDFEYDTIQTKRLIELSKLIRRIITNRDLFSTTALGLDKPHSRSVEQRFMEIRNLVFSKLKSDPIGVYVELTRILRREKIAFEKSVTDDEAEYARVYGKLIENILSMMGEISLIQIVKPKLPGYKLGDRYIYREVLNPDIKPDFLYTRIQSQLPVNASEVESYNVKGSEINIFETSDNVSYLYHVTPPEYKLNEDKYEILDVARRIIAEHKPTRSEFVDPERMRHVFKNVGSDLIEELAENKGLNLRTKEIEELTNILIRYTVGFGMVEVLLSDEKVQDVTVNSPYGQSPIYIVHQDYDDMVTNIIPTVNDAESWATKLRLISGRPFDEANPILDTELIIPGSRARVTVVGEPINPQGIAYAYRRHRDRPWTLPLFMKNGMIDPLAAGITSFLVDGSRTMLIAGTRSAGKSSFLGAIMTEIMRKYRIITVEDTLELPVKSLKQEGYNIQPLRVASALTSSNQELSADEGIRTTLRMGDSALIVGEVRSVEARALYEAMRVGALANVVAGTIHGDSPYGVYDRVVNDLGVQKTSFKATDVIFVANPIRTPDGLHRTRRITQITEVGKFWENDPIAENGFTDLMKYDPVLDKLKPSDQLLNGEIDVLKSIAGNVKEWAGSWDAVWENIQLRADVKQTLLEQSEKAKNPNFLEAGFVIKSNDEFHKISDDVRVELGSFDNKRILFEWKEWLKREMKKELRK